MDRYPSPRQPRCPARSGPARDPEISDPRSRPCRPVDARRCGAQSDQRSVGVLTPGRGTRTIIIGSAIAVHAPSPAATSPVLPPSSPPGREIRGSHAPGPGESSAATEGWAGGEARGSLRRVPPLETLSPEGLLYHALAATRAAVREEVPRILVPITTDGHPSGRMFQTDRARAPRASRGQRFNA